MKKTNLRTIYSMNKRFTNILIILFSVLSLFGRPIQQVQAEQQDDMIPAGDFLLPDGTFDLTQNYHGTVDTSNFDVELDPTRGPVFKPNGIANAWNPLGNGLNGIVYAIAVVGTDIYVGGGFTDAGGVAAADYIAKWDGTTWSALGSGINNIVFTIAVRGSDIYAGGGFTNAGGISGNNYIAKWDGTNWSALGSNALNSWVNSIAVHGADVYVGGDFINAGGVSAADYIARWNGGSWSALGAGLNNSVQSIAVSGASIYVGGRFTDAGGVTDATHIARWNGTTWSALGNGLNYWVYSIAVNQADVYVGGAFTNAGGVATADYIAKWNGSAWFALGSNINDTVSSIAVSGADVFIGGKFTNASGVAAADYIAKWDGSNWSALGNEALYEVYALALLGKDLYAGGLFTNAIARFEFPSQTILVTTSTDEITSNGQCSLREAITAAQTNLAVDSCAAGASHDTIIFDDTVSNITLADHLPIIFDPYGLTINGGRDVEINGSNLWHPFSIEKAGLGNGLSKPILILENITIRGGHRGSGSGGAITNDDGLVIIRNSNFTTNFSGVLENSPGGYVIISNSTFSFNGSPNGSGAISNIGSPSPSVIKIYNSTISANASGALGAVNNDSFLYIYNTIIGDNLGTGIDCSENLTYGVTYGMNNLINTNYCSFTNGVNGNIIGSHPDLGSLIGSPAYFQLNNGSPAIDAGNNAICAEPPVNNESQNEVTRPQGATCDIGAVEVPSLSSSIFKSNATNDGWILESSENSNTGGTLNSTNKNFVLGDDAADKQYRAILHFDTSALPDTAVVTNMTLKIKQQGSVTGTSPFTFASLYVDMRNPAFGTSALELTDFNFAAKKVKPAVFNPNPVSSWFSARFNTGGKLYVNRTGVSQLRLYFSVDDNNNNIADFIKFASGNAAAGDRPKLIIQYYIP